MQLDAPFEIELEYVQRMMAWMLFVDAAERGASATRCSSAWARPRSPSSAARQLRMRTTAIELNPQVVAACRGWFQLPADDARLQVVVADAAPRSASRSGSGTVDALQVDLYDHEAAAPVLDSEAFYARLPRAADRGRLHDGQPVRPLVQLRAQPGEDRRGLRRRGGLGLQADARRQHRRAGASASPAGPSAPRLPSAPQTIETRWGLPAPQVAAGVQTCSMTACTSMSAVATPQPPPAAPPGPARLAAADRVAARGRRDLARRGPAHAWRAARRPKARQASAGAAGERRDDARERRQAARHRDADRSGWPAAPACPTCASTRCKVDVGRSPTSCARPTPSAHRCCRCRSAPTEVTVATASPSSPTGSPRSSASAPHGAAGGRQPASTSQRYTTEFFALAKSVRAAQKAGGNAGARQLRAAGRARQEQQAARRQRPGRGAGGRLAVAVRLRPARLRHPPRAAARAGRDPLSHRRRAAHRSTRCRWA